MTTMSPLDETGKPVDWWFLYKVPRLARGPLSGASAGYEYVYYDAEKGLVPSKNVLLSGNGALDLTLSALFDKPAASTGWILYNDEEPAIGGGRTSSTLGHTKGLLAFDTASQTGVWLLHSWPKFAEPADRQSVAPAADYGQTFVAVALDLQTIRDIAGQMANHQQPQTYQCRIPQGLVPADPLRILAGHLNATSPAASDAIDCTTRGGLPFKVIAKNRKWGRDFWNDLVAHVLAEDIDVDTWIRGRNVIPPNKDSDGPHEVFDIKFIDLRPLGTPWAWPEVKDHAKWGITYRDNWICVGDINRMISQEKRGGGCIAFQDPGLWAALKKTDLLVLPSGVSEDTAVAAIHATHKLPPPKRRTITLPRAVAPRKTTAAPGSVPAAAKKPREK